MRRVRASDLESTVAASSFAFLANRLEERVTLEWAIKLNKSNVGERSAVQQLFERRELKVAEPYLSAWRMVFHFWERPDQASSYDRLLLKRDLKLMTSPRETVRLIVDSVRPWLKVSVRGRLEALYGLPIPKRPKKVRDLLSVTFSSGDTLTPEELGLSTVSDSDFLEELAKGLDAALFGSLALAREIGTVSDRTDETLWQLHRSYFVPSDQWEEGGNEPDRFGHGFANCVKLLHAVIERLAAVKPSAAERQLAALPHEDWGIYLRLWAALARDPLLASSTEVESFLTRLPDTPFWSLGQYPEVAELRAVRWRSISLKAQRDLEARLRRGTPASLRPSRLNAEERRDYSRRRASAELQRIAVGGAQLSPLSIAFIKEVNSSPHAPVVGSVVAGFDGGVRVYSRPAEDIEKYGDLSPERLLQLMRKGGDEDDGNAASFLGKNPTLAADLLITLEAKDNAIGGIWRALGHYHRPPDLNANLETANPETIETLGPARSILAKLAELDYVTIEKEIEPLTSWMYAWDKLLTADPLFSEAWFRLWPAAVMHVNAASDEGDGALENRAYGSPVGNLVSSVLSAMPDLSKTPDNPFERPPLNDVLSRFAECDGEARLQVQYRLIQGLPYFHRVSPDWAMRNLVEPLRDANGTSMQLWKAFTRAQLPQPPVMREIGTNLAAAAVDGNLPADVRTALARQVIWSHVLPKLPTPHSAAVDVSATQQMLRMGDDHVRVGAAKALKDLLQQESPDLDLDGRYALMKAIFQEVWPRERTLNSPSVSDALVELPAASRQHFSEVSAMVMPYLSPFDCWSLYDYGIWATEDQGRSIRGVETAQKAEALLGLMDKTIGDFEGAVIPAGLDLALQHIRSLVPAIDSDPRYQRLLTLSRR